MKVAHHCFELRKVTSYLLYGLSFVGYLQENSNIVIAETFCSWQGISEKFCREMMFLFQMDQIASKSDSHCT